MCSAKKICRLPWGLDPDFLGSCGQSPGFVTPSGFPEGRVLLTVGRWMANERYKGAGQFNPCPARPAGSGADFHLVALGEGDDRSRLEGLARELGLGQRVHFLNWVPKNELAACYACCEIFALPSSGEGFGLVFLEAMALEKPVVGGAHGGTLDLIQDGVTGFLVPHGDARQTGRRIAEVALNESLRREMGRKARAHVLSHFHFEHFRAGLKGIVAQMDLS